MPHRDIEVHLECQPTRTLHSTRPFDFGTFPLGHVSRFAELSTCGATLANCDSWKEAVVSTDVFGTKPLWCQPQLWNDDVGICLNSLLPVVSLIFHQAVPCIDKQASNKRTGPLLKIQDGGTKDVTSQ